MSLDFLKSKILLLIVLAVSLVCAGYFAYRGHQWWQKQQRQKQLFVYFQKNSPLTKKMPADAVAYLNLYDLKRIYEQWRGTRFYDVLTHWLDTGMSGKQKANPLLGGMVEKTAINVLGDEFAVALLPSSSDNLEFLAIARIAPGSDFLLNLALSSNKNTEKADLDEHILYSIETKVSAYPRIHVLVEDNYAYASGSIDRIRQALKENGPGPGFLQDLKIEAIPEDTFLFFRTPKAGMLGNGTGTRYRFTAAATEKVRGFLPDQDTAASSVLSLQTNAMLMINQPGASFSVQSVNGIPASAAHLVFENGEKARSYQKSILDHFAAANPSQPLDESSENGIRCFRYSKNGTAHAICGKGINLLLTYGPFDFSQTPLARPRKTPGELPLTLRMIFRQETIPEYSSLVEKKDWSRFPEAKVFYLLSCIKQLQGAIDGNSSEIITEIH